jgi:thiamine-phosphate pyrophosphorylase
MNRPLLRLLDANANRAREALRVVEDYARFVLDDPDLCGVLKGIRHELITPLRDVLADAVLHRDTPGDVGTTVSTTSEVQRDDLAHVVTAAGKRLGEALRAMEEALKVVAPAHAPGVERLRYRFYAVEQDVQLTLRPSPSRFADVRLYVVVTESVCRGPWLAAAEAALLGGADCLQLREKDLEAGELLRRAIRLKELCARHGALFIVNDRPDVALAAGADGVHVGQGDLPAREVRRLVGRGMIVGVSTHEIAQARRAVLDGADYVGVGPVFRSPTKPRDFLPGLDFARAAAEHVPVLAVAIAGITAANVDEVLATGLRAVAVSSAVLRADDARAAAAELKARLVREGREGTRR